MLHKYTFCLFQIVSSFISRSWLTHSADMTSSTPNRKLRKNALGVPRVQYIHGLSECARGSAPEANSLRRMATVLTAAGKIKIPLLVLFCNVILRESNYKRKFDDLFCPYCRQPVTGSRWLTSQFPGYAWLLVYSVGQCIVCCLVRVEYWK